MLQDEYSWWRRALKFGKGRELGREQLSALSVTESDPQPGFYRCQSEDGRRYLPVAIWRQDGELRCMQGSRWREAEDIWSWCCRWPISEELYRQVVAGGSWPEEPSTAAIGHNRSADPFEALCEEFAEEAQQAETFLGQPITTQGEADKAAVWAKRLAGIAKKATDLHKVEKQPALDECRRVDDKWRELREGADRLSKQLKRHLDTFLVEQARLEEERQKAAREQAETLQRQAEEAAAQAEAATNAVDNASAKAEADRLSHAARLAAEEAAGRTAGAGRTGAKVSLRTFISAEITDYDALLGALKDRSEIRELVQTLANRAARAGQQLAGMRILEERRAA